MKKKGDFIGSFICITLFFIMFLSLVSAQTFSLGNSSFQTNYVYSEPLKGWMNISLTNVPFNSIIGFNGANISVLDLLKMNLAANEYNCSLPSCEVSYSNIGSGSDIKDFNLNYGDSAVYGMKIQTANLSSVGSLILTLGSNAPETCNSPISVDVLDDGVMDWVSNSVSTSLCQRLDNGCYDSSSAATAPIEAGKEYCENFNVNPFPDLSIGAKIYGNSSATFQMHIFDDTNELDRSCSFSLSSTGTLGDREGSCLINQSRAVNSNVTVCLSSTSASNNNFNYQIYYETTNPVCGYAGEYGHDFSIFVDPVKYGRPNSVVLNSSKLPNADIQQYVDAVYGGDCTGGCFIPVRIFSGLSHQEINLSSASLTYSAAWLKQTTNSLYLLGSQVANINMAYKKISLNGAGLDVPSQAGNFTLPLMLDNQTIINLKINVLTLPNILGISPEGGPAAVPITFTLQVSGSNVTSYLWNFGDNTTLVTTTNKVKHTYGSIGSYNLMVNASNEKGTTSSNFAIDIISPESFINQTLVDQTSKLNTIKNKISSLPSFVQTFIQNQLKLTDIETQLQSARVNYNNAAGTPEQYIEIMNSIYSINLPQTINVTYSDSGSLIFDPAIISLDTLSAITRENVNYGEANLQKAILEWYIHNLNANVKLATYSAVYEDHSDILGTDIVLNVNPISNQDKVYLVINAPTDRISGLDGLTSAGNSSALEMSISSATEKEFIIMSPVKILDLPIYFSPVISTLNLAVEVGDCNYNNVCESTLGENSSNCRNDCKPWGWSIFYIILVLIIVFILYIIIQEWYKRNYENYLFKNKDELYNLIHFMDNAEKQGMKRGDIMSKLREKGWSNEKIVYAYKKYKGERTGMLEIPVLRFMEKKKVASELEKRKLQTPFNPNNNLQPGKKFANK